MTLDKKFFKENPLIKRSPAAIVYYRIRSNADAVIHEQLQQFAGDPEFAERFRRQAEERQLIESLSSGEALVSMLRKNFDPLNLTALCDKALALGDEAMEAMLRRYRTSLQDSYIEAVIYILAKADLHWTERLLEEFPTIRNPYARSLACMLFGLQQLSCTEELLVKEYRTLLNDPREPALAQGPLLGLYILHDKTVF